VAPRPRGGVPRVTLAVAHELDQAPKTAQHVANGIMLARLKTSLETGYPTPMPEPA